MIGFRFCISFLTVAALGLLTGCGFQPLYSQNSTGATQQASAKLESTRVEPIKGHLGQLLYTHLSDLLYPGGEAVDPQYALRATVKKQSFPTAIQPDGRISRYNLVITADYTLIDLTTHQPIKGGKGSARLSSSYDAVLADFATFVAEEDTTERLIKEMAEEIRMRVALTLMRDGSGDQNATIRSTASSASDNAE